MRLLRIVALFALAFGIVPAHAADPYKLRIGWVVAGAGWSEGVGLMAVLGSVFLKGRGQ